MNNQAPITIIGTGLAGYTLAKEIRKLDKEVQLLLISADDGSFYSKPMLSNALAQGKSADSLASKSAEMMADELNAEILGHTLVEKISPQDQTLQLQSGIRTYGKLVLASGATPIRFPPAGDGAKEMLSINNLDDYRNFRNQLANIKRVAIMGPGLIGCEFANDLNSAGIEVDLFGPDPWPISTLLPEPAGRALQSALGEKGIRLHLDTVAERIDKQQQGYTVQLGNGSVIDTDLVLSAVGLRANTTLAQEAGLTCNRGIVTNLMLETSVDGIYALGDCAEIDGEVRPFVMPIMHGARALAKTLLGDKTAVKFPPMPVAIKTPALPTVVSPPPAGSTGEWEISGESADIRAIFVDHDGKMIGFALTGAACSEKQALTKQL